MIALARPVMLYHKIEIDVAAAGSAITASSVFGLGLPLVVTNAAGTSLGGVVTDADVTITLAEGGVADDFTIVLYDLPAPAVSALKAKVGKADAPGLSVTVRLGYLDTPTTVYSVKPVLRGRVTKITEATNDAGRGTVTLTGEEEVGYVLRTTRAAGKIDKGDADKLVTDLLGLAKTRATTLGIAAENLKVTAGSKLGIQRSDYTVNHYSVLAALADLAEQAKQALVVSGEGVAFGAAVGGGSNPVTFEATTNTVTFSTSTKEKSDATAGPAAGSGGASGSSLAAAGSAAAAALAGGAKDAGATATITALGDPELRVGRPVIIADGNPTSPWKGKTLRIQQVKHVYDSNKGFTTEVRATAAESGGPAGDFAGARGVVDEWNRQIGKDRTANPSVDMGEVASYVAGSAATPTDAGHRTTLHYGPKPDDQKPDGQKPGAQSTPTPASGAAKPPKESPSTDQEITDDIRSDLLNRPVASIFAFDKVGLITPVYPKMRAVLVHNGQATNDAIVAGWLWPTKPAMTPPPSQTGDYWLALPTELDGDGLPTGKGVNDLTDKNGNRVITARSTRIVVGQSALDDVGKRPKVTEPDSLVIEHSSGTKITVDKDGGITIDSAGEVKLTTQSKPITLGNGSVAVKIDGASVQVGQ
ncbi:hypothetical protein GCM10011575_34830 [Microlunatus endophyticus]|uniref:Uncharacterized protein n=1 Tax=Microlunatus endophyticus TaxID=1716077 RepID=A0A917W663_9ACTN|nr:hypothetical protein [Microlunatus endophyticus]GGL73519.1 hypothetical protein GCM10011575_34830 [Microlunatus endophyticus]